MSLKIVSYLLDPDGTEKFVFNDDNGVLEIVRINTKDERDIYCVPSMYQCLLGCKMCYLTINNIRGSSKKIPSKTIDSVIDEIRTNYPTYKLGIQISVMGVGDPLLNMELIDDLCENEDYSRVSISTIFPIIPKRKFNDKLKIHFSLHSPFDKKRKEIIPNIKNSIDQILYYLDRHKGQVEFHYTLMDGINDSDEELEEIKKLLSAEGDTIKFLDFKTSDKTEIGKSKKVEQWMESLKPYMTVEYYYPPGEKIQGSCGLFTEGFYSKTVPNKDFMDMIENYSQPINHE